jgi:hypothetical protein
VARLAVQDACPVIDDSVSEEIGDFWRSDLLKRKYVSGLIRGCKALGMRAWGPLRVSSMTSGKDRTHRDTSAVRTLRNITLVTRCFPKHNQDQRIIGSLNTNVFDQVVGFP